MEIIKQKIEREITKKCVCYACEAELLVSMEDLNHLYNFKCPICNRQNLWATENDKKIMSQIRDEERLIVLGLKNRIPKKYHSIIEKEIGAHANSLCQFIVENYITKEA